MSMLQDVLREERERAERMQAALARELEKLPRGYISRKMIRGKPAFYLQRREGDKVVGRYIPKEELEGLRQGIARRKQLLAMDREAKETLRRIGRALKP
ncbi:MAG: hypothetical protein GX653_06250 [Clostridiales bacterium]|nr:hypothetical protein [Clostridiales bacterium]